MATKQDTRQETTYNKLVGRKDDEYYFCDYIFKDGNLQGATATVLRPVPKQEWEERQDPNNLREEYRDLWVEAVSHNDTDQGLDDWMEYMDIEPYYDDSGSEYHESLYDLGLDQEDYPVIECTGGGRSFDKLGARGQAFDEVYDQELLEKIQAVEK